MDNYWEELLNIFIDISVCRSDTSPRPYAEILRSSQDVHHSPKKYSPVNMTLGGNDIESL